MPPSEPSWEEVAWTWDCPTGHEALDKLLDTAAKAAWSYAVLSAWIYLNDHDAAHDLMDHAITNAAQYLTRHQDVTTDKLAARIRSVLRRRARQIAHKRRHELMVGTLADLEGLIADATFIDERVYATQLLSRLSPFAESIVNQRWSGFTWREIAQEMQMDHTVVRRAFLRELRTLSDKMNRSGGGHK